MLNKKNHICEKDCIWNPATCSCKNGKNVASIIDDSVIMYDEVIDAEKTETVTVHFKTKHAIWKTNNFYFYLFFINYYYVINSC